MISLGQSTPSIGLYMGTNTIRAAQIKPGTPKPQLVKYATQATPHGAVVEGEIADHEILGRSLQQMWSRQGFKSKNVVIGLANQKLVIRLIELPFMEKEELKGALQFQAQDYIPIPIEEAILDFQIVGEFMSDEEERMMEVLIVAAQKDMISQAVSAIQFAGLKPHIIDASAFALVRALMPPQGFIPTESEVAASEEAVAVVFFGDGVTNIAVVDGGIPKFARSSPFGVNNFISAIADRLNVAVEQAINLSELIGLPQIKGRKIAIPKEVRDFAEPVQEIMTDEMLKFVVEVRRSIDYYLSQVRQVKSISKLILVGSGANVNNLIDHLSEELQLTIEIGDPFTNVILDPKLKIENFEIEKNSMAPAIGLAMRGAEK